MSRKDYIATARIIRALRLANYIDDRARDIMARSFADMYATDNARFDRDRFYFACGIAGAPSYGHMASLLS